MLQANFAFLLTPSATLPQGPRWGADDDYDEEFGPADDKPARRRRKGGAAEEEEGEEEEPRTSPKAGRWVNGY